MSAGDGPLPRGRFRPRSDVRFRLIDGEAVVLRQDTGQVLVLNETGARILELIAETGDAATLPDRLLEEVEADRARLEADVGAFLGLLVERRIIEPETR